MALTKVGKGGLDKGAIKDQTNLGAEAADTDEFLLYDASADGLKAIQSQNVVGPGIITNKTEITTGNVAGGDFLLIYDTSAGALKKISKTGSWEWLGEAALSLIGIEIGFIFFGFLAALSEGILSLLVMFGFFTRLSSFFLMVTMIFASAFHLAKGEAAELATIYLSIYLALFILGPGQYSVDKKFFK